MLKKTDLDQEPDAGGSGNLRFGGQCCKVLGGSELREKRPFGSIPEPGLLPSWGWEGNVW